MATKMDLIRPLWEGSYFFCLVSGQGQFPDSGSATWISQDVILGEVYCEIKLAGHVLPTHSKHVPTHSKHVEEMTTKRFYQSKPVEQWQLPHSYHDKEGSLTFACRSSWQDWQDWYIFLNNWQIFNLKPAQNLSFHFMMSYSVLLTCPAPLLGILRYLFINASSSVTGLWFCILAWRRCWTWIQTPQIFITNFLHHMLHHN